MNSLERFLHKRKLKKFWNLQKLILPLINNPIARKYLGVPWNKRIVMVTPNSVHFQKNKKENQAIFYSSPVIKEKGKRAVKTGTQVALMLLVLGIPKSLVLSLIALSTFYPDADPETNTVDGLVRRNYTASTWADLRDGAGTEAYPSFAGPGDTASLFSSATTNAWDTLVRSIYLFDTSSLPDDCTITSATFSLYIDSVQDNFDQAVGVVSSNPASNTDLVPADYGTLGTTRYATDIDITNITVGQYTDWDLNSSGIAAISKTGITKLGVRLSGDIDNIEPTWQASLVGEINARFADYGSTQPKLVVNYTIPKSFTITETSIVNYIKEVNKIFPITETSVLTFSKFTQYLKEFAITEISVISFEKWKAFLKEFAITIQGIVSFEKWKKYLKEFAIQVQGVISFIRQISKQFAITAQGVVSLQRWSVFLKQFSITITSVISFLKQWLKIVYYDKFKKQGDTYIDKYSKQGDSYTDKY